MRELLEAVADGSLSPAQAEAQLKGYVTGEAGRFDAARQQRRGIPEAILADGKTPAQVVALAETALETTDRALLTRLSEAQFEALEDAILETFPDATFDRWSGSLLIRTPDYERPSLEATVGLVTAGTVDQPVADEAEAVCVDAGATVDRVDDIGVAALDRTLDQVDRLREADVLIVAAGREGALPTVIAGLVDTPVIGLPVSSGYGYGGDGEAALSGMLQSCTVMSVVNVDAGFVAGAQATLIARAIDAARTDGGEDEK
ncbi:nickel pincer cofactor biosynthesis protein LarB [Halopiger thermotolerans]